MRILVTNDDGITAPGLRIAEKIAHDIAGPDGDVWTIAPAFEQSGVGHCISFSRPAMITQLAERRFAIEGTPADCVLGGLHHVLNQAPDLIISGVNRGNNAGENALYSGTLGAAMEGALQGVRSIALSAFISPDNKHDIFGASEQFGAATVRKLLDIWPDEQPGYGLFWNVNFPACTADQVGKLRLTTQGYRGHGHMNMSHSQSPNRREYLWVTAQPQGRSGEIPASDMQAVLDFDIAAVPMRADLTCAKTLQHFDANTSLDLKTEAHS